MSYILIFPFLAILLIFCFFFYHLIWYDYFYKTKEQTDKHDIGWHKCWDCKKVESTMYYDHNLFGRIYRCKECSDRKHKNT